jgi:hypothetical protein
VAAEAAAEQYREASAVMPAKLQPHPSFPAMTNHESLHVSALSANFQNLTVVLRNLLQDLSFE